MGTYIGVLKVAAGRVGVTFEDYVLRRAARDQCRLAGVAYFSKQLGTHPLFSVGAAEAPCSIPLRGKGDLLGQWPADLQGREYPMQMLDHLQRRTARDEVRAVPQAPRPSETGQAGGPSQ